MADNPLALLREEHADGTTDGIAVGRAWTIVDCFGLELAHASSGRTGAVTCGRRGRSWDHLQNRWSVSLCSGSSLTGGCAWPAARSQKSANRADNALRALLLAMSRDPQVTTASAARGQ